MVWTEQERSASTDSVSFMARIGSKKAIAEAMREKVQQH